MAATTRLAAVRPEIRLPEIRLPEPLTADRTHSVALRWVISRAITLMLLVGVENDVIGDVEYYGRSLHVLFSGGTLHNTLIEYPLPVMLVLLPPFLLGGLNQIAFSILFVLAMLAVVIAFTVTGRARHRISSSRAWSEQGAVQPKELRRWMPRVSTSTTSWTGQVLTSIGLEPVTVRRRDAAP